MEETYKNLYTMMLREHEAVFAQQDLVQMRELMNAIKDCSGSIMVVGCGREGIAARSFAMRLAHLGKRTHWLWDDTTPGMHSGDLFICVNGSGAIGNIMYVYEQAKATGADIAMITGDPIRCPKDVQHTLFIPAMVYRGTCNDVVNSDQPMGNLFEQHLFLLFDVIVMMLEKELGQSNAEMEARHRNIE
ncbi:putative 6-phospho 3-hexuloisomerase [Leptomonas seymouri]|uniref:Putative 6-phospho 3-hexuloisomerase n=1 Tax=Leptomonas seymouri TaxID=5684 RepID=A0A0N1HWF3_LEPSE|nr:putative 6-phospho 3-hexuloisomerase [Leptomonas seymouri]|eukprot:KPI86381.1 putative 6-phospho 3-hexuloisomerase [Leptomonas seymouri]